MSIWLALRESPGWQALKVLYEKDLEDLALQLLSIAQESSDPRVRGVAWKIVTIKDLLRRVDWEFERTTGEDEA